MVSKLSNCPRVEKLIRILTLDRSEPAKKGKYTFLERSYEESDDEGGDNGVKKEEDDEEASQVESKLPRQTQRLVELIFNQNHFNAVLESIGYNANKLPLGKLSKATLKQGFDHLNELASLIKHPALAQNKHGVDQREVSFSSSLIGCCHRSFSEYCCCWISFPTQALREWTNKSNNS